MIEKINTEFKFTREVNEELTIGLTLYIDYRLKTYDFMQDDQEGVFPSTHNHDTEINRAYFELGLEILIFVENELY